jgi:hypothetical protein
MLRLSAALATTAPIRKALAAKNTKRARKENLVHIFPNPSNLV